MLLPSFCNFFAPRSHLCNHHVFVLAVFDTDMFHFFLRRDPEGLRGFYYLVQDLKCFVFSLIGLHFKIKPI